MSAMNAIVAWLVSAMMAWSPVGQKHRAPENKETVEETTQRYNAIARATVDVAYDPLRAPLVREEEYARAKTALLLLAVASYESGFLRGVDLGLGKKGRGDYGRSHCMMQINLGRNRTDTSVLTKLIGEEWSGNDLVEDRVKCFTAGHVLISKSLNACRQLPFHHRLAAYASGSCEGGHQESRLRLTRGINWYALHKAPVADSVVMDEHNSAPKDLN